LFKIRRRDAWLVVILAGPFGGPGQAQELAAGQLLVASRKSVDPDLAKTVVLLVHYGPDGALGLIVNRRSSVPVSEVFPSLQQARASVYTGGPIAIGIRALLRSRSKPAQAVHVFGEISMTSNRKLIEDQLKEELARTGSESSSFRIYAGYTGWSADQLKSEIALGLWRVQAGDAGVVFAKDPAKVWDRMISELH
jgi:putative transcriptional regulator